MNGSHEQGYDLGHAYPSEVSVQSQALLTSHRSWATLKIIFDAHMRYALAEERLEAAFNELG
jgi:hypothetical protein